VQERPKARLAGMHLSETRHELVVSLEANVVFDLCVQAVDLMNVACSMLVTSGTPFLQREFDKGPTQQDRGQWVFAFKS